jgi:hypothetical protein
VSTKTRKLIFFILLINFHTVSYCQVIKGSVLDRKTKEPIGFAYLYFSGTFSGTQSDLNGDFVLDVSIITPRPLTISAIGYYSTTLNDYVTGKPLTVYLVPKLYELREVNINARSLARKRKSNMILFRNEFLGTTSNASGCEILNENDITFNYDSDDDTLKVYASKPIRIDNKALGYSITYYLDKFEYIRDTKSFFFKGDMIFNEDLSIGAEQKEVFERKRRYAYLGSRMHFFRALWYNDLKSTGFIIKNASNENLKYKDLVFQDPYENKYLRYGEDLGICYFSKEPLSNIKFLKDKVFFGKDGYFDPSGIAWEGKMASLRVGDWLPYEYAVKEY